MPAVLQKDKRQQKALELLEQIEEIRSQLSALLENDPNADSGKISPRVREQIVAVLEAGPTTIRSEEEHHGGQIAKKRSGVKPAAKYTSFDPFEAGRKVVAKMQAAEGGAWTGTELEELFGLTPANLHKRREEHRIVWWKDAKNRFHYPKWQFNYAGALRSGVQEVLGIFRSSDEWRVMRYFLTPWHQLDDRTPLELLRTGEKEKVISHARAHGEENSW